MSMTTSGIMHRTVEANGIHLHIAEQGDGPVVVLCHGVPKSWYSWRHECSRSPALNRTTYFFTEISFPAMPASVAKSRPKRIIYSFQIS
jgi:pimeloyl-ACP methyl ester carboxylesterase